MRLAPLWVRAIGLLDRRDSSAISASSHCASYQLPSGGIIQISPGNMIALSADAIFRAPCTTVPQGALQNDSNAVVPISDISDPFHASITPQAYATGAATVIAWMLVIMLIITPRTFFLGNASGRSGLLGRRGMIGGASGGESIIGIGSRPWLQKAAALTVAISLTLATSDTFKIAARQYAAGFIDALDLRLEVVAGSEIKVSRIISDVFLWLAQVQTLIRLFPRHKEKVLIKWVGFALILLDITFSLLNSFGPFKRSTRPARFDTAIPALSYLFQLSLSMLYAAWVMYYAITKRRYAFYHSMMWNITVVALLSIIAILTPVVFFITDIANYTIAGWGDYFRWVGAAAASVIVWEWVERIEALEREERKDGILGREVYDGDDMLDNLGASTSPWPSQRKSQHSEHEMKKPGRGLAARESSLGRGARFQHLVQKLARNNADSPGAKARRKRNIHVPAPAPVAQRQETLGRAEDSSQSYLRMRTPPPIPVVASPVSRTDTTSADSTVYTVRYHPISESPQNRPSEALGRLQTNGSLGAAQQQQQPQQRAPDPFAHPDDPERGIETNPESVTTRSRWQWQGVRNAFQRKGRTPPQELERGRVIEPLGVEHVIVQIPQRNYNGLALSDRLGTFAAQQGEKLRHKKKRSAEEEELDLPVTIIPAQPRGKTWSPNNITHSPPIPHEPMPISVGVQLAHVPTTIAEEEHELSSMQSVHKTTSCEAVHPSTTPQSYYASRARNNSESSRLAADRAAHTSLSPSSILGSTVSQPPPSPNTNFSMLPSRPPSNHD